MQHFQIQLFQLPECVICQIIEELVKEETQGRSDDSTLQSFQ